MEGSPEPAPAPTGSTSSSSRDSSDSKVAGVTSSLWGSKGELWDPAGRLPDFSFAGYKQGAEHIPTPPVTRSVLDFRQPGASDTQMLVAALDWANAQNLTDDYIVLSLPAGEFTLEALLAIRRSKVVLRGAGAGATVLNIPKSITDLVGPNPDYEKTGGWVNNGAFVTLQGSIDLNEALAVVTGSAEKGDNVVTVDNSSRLVVGQVYDTCWDDVGGRFNNMMFDNLWEAPAKYAGKARVKFATKITGIRGQQVTLERRLPYAVQPGAVTVEFHARPTTVHDSGVEGLTFAFKWEPYAGHHLERGWTAVEFSEVYDCWARDIATINADNTVVMSGSTSVTVSGVLIEMSKTRANTIPNAFDETADRDGHWGVHHARSFDVLVRDFDVRCALMHDMGTGSGGKWGVFMDGVMMAGNLDLHRALAGPTLYTNISAGGGTDTFYSGGPPESGPNALAGTTWWGITTTTPVQPPHSNGTIVGHCSFGPQLNLVGVNLAPAQAAGMCQTWLYEREVDTPQNLYIAQLALRRAAASLSRNSGVGTPAPLAAHELAPAPLAPAPLPVSSDWH